MLTFRNRFKSDLVTDVSSLTFGTLIISILSQHFYNPLKFKLNLEHLANSSFTISSEIVR